ncbi:hypothetical protein HNR36_000887 [Ureibacillus thermosphaericus]|jgi:hypothetical protein|uniref:Uncharacterized protein n=1 Tax=Ureibacillus thermosphaericus TaxID=51173 RepID=A0A840PUT9_URETH|nr:hypothetical protein [Ureibacillus thermosphaericus]
MSGLEKDWGYILICSLFAKAVNGKIGNLRAF